MKESQSNQEIIAYAEAFASFVLPKITGVKEIILFGSAARNEAEKESDIDLFFDLEKKDDEAKIKKILEQELEKFYKSKIAEIWHLKGIKNQISFNVGILEEWELKRSIISDGICLYGKYKELPANLKAFVYFNIEPIKNISKRNRIIRKIFGRNEKGYYSTGLVQELNGKKLSSSSFVAPKENSDRIIKEFGKEKINYKMLEIWTDNLNL